MDDDYVRRLKWDLRFLELSKLVSTWSKDPSTKVGAVIVRPNHSVCSVGFNGFPQGMDDRDEWLSDRPEKYSRVIHAEVNARIFSSERVEGYTLYTYPLLPCDRCVVQMLQEGIVRFVAPLPSEDALSRWGDALIRTRRYIFDAGHEYFEIDIENREDF